MVFEQTKIAARIKTHIGIQAAIIGIWQNRIGCILSVFKRIGKTRIDATSIARPSADIAITFEVIVQGLGWQHNGNKE